LYRDPRSDMPVTQFNLKYVELAGLVKFDFLGLTTLTILAKALELLKRRGVTLDLENLPLDDEATYRLLGRGDTVGVFQLEGAGMRDMLKKLRPDRFEDIIAVVALYRPGPMENIPRYISVKHGAEAPDYLHPALEGILKETYGVMTYQEQVMQIAQVLAGYTLGGADLLRRAMGKKDAEEMAQQRSIFVDGAVARGVPARQATHIFDLMEKFAGYGFNKSHSAAYAMLSFQTAYLKANYPAQFMAAVLSADMDRTDKVVTLIDECKTLGLTVQVPDVNSSGYAFRADGQNSIRYGLGAVKGVGRLAVDAIVKEREAHGHYRSLEDLCHRTDLQRVNKRVLEALVRSGSFDALGASRAALMEGLAIAMRSGEQTARTQETGQFDLLGLPTFDAPAAP